MLFSKEVRLAWLRNFIRVYSIVYGDLAKDIELHVQDITVGYTDLPSKFCLGVFLPNWCRLDMRGSLSADNLFPDKPGKFQRVYYIQDCSVATFLYVFEIQRHIYTRMLNLGGYSRTLMQILDRYLGGESLPDKTLTHEDFLRMGFDPKETGLYEFLSEHELYRNPLINKTLEYRYPS